MLPAMLYTYKPPSEFSGRLLTTNHNVSTRVGVNGQDKVSMLLFEQLLGMANELDLRNEMPPTTKTASKLQARQWRVASWGFFEVSRLALSVIAFGSDTKTFFQVRLAWHICGRRRMLNPTLLVPILDRSSILILLSNGRHILTPNQRCLHTAAGDGKSSIISR